MTINASSMASSTEVDSILGQIKKEVALGQNNNTHMQVIGLEEEVRRKEVTIKGLHSKIFGLDRQLNESNAKIEGVESENKKMKAVIAGQEAKITSFEKQEEDMISLKEKNAKVLQTAKEHQKGWKDSIRKLEVKMSEKEKENHLLRAKMAKLLRNLEGTIADFSDLDDQELSLASTSESEGCDTIEDQNTDREDNIDDFESKKLTKMEKVLNASIDPTAEKIHSFGFFSRFQAANE